MSIKTSPNVVSSRFLAITPDGKEVVSASVHKCTIHVWSLADDQVCVIPTHSPVSSLTLTPDGTYVVCGHFDRSVGLFSLDNREQVRSFTGHCSWVSTVTVTPDGKRIIGAGGVSGDICVWSLESGEQEQCIHVSGWHVNRVVATPDGRHVVCGTADGSIQVMSLENGEQVQRIERVGTASVDITPDGRYIVCGGCGGHVVACSLESDERLFDIHGHSERVSDVAITPDGRYAVSCGRDSMIHVWSLENKGQHVQAIVSEFPEIDCLAITPDGRHVVAGASCSDVLRVWPLDSEEMDSLVAQVEALGV